MSDEIKLYLERQINLHTAAVIRQVPCTCDKCQAKDQDDES